METTVVIFQSGDKNDTSQRIAMTRRTRAQQRGQFWLSEEIRLAPFPIPARKGKQATLSGAAGSAQKPAAGEPGLELAEVGTVAADSCSATARFP